MVRTLLRDAASRIYVDLESLQKAIECIEAESRSVAYDGEKKIGECDWRDNGENCIIYHTEVDPRYGGKKIAKRLVYSVVEQAERRKKKIVPTCSYAAKVLGE